VLEQRLTAPRFGFDSEPSPGAAPAQPGQTVAPSWADEPWSGVGVPAGGHIKLAAEPFATKLRGGRRFGAAAGEIAASLLQRPVRVSLHRDRLLVHPGGGA
jgi:hypothetical protein